MTAPIIEAAARAVKWCRRCMKFIPLTMFHKDRYRADGLSGLCKACDTARNAKYRASEAGRASTRAIIIHRAENQRTPEYLAARSARDKKRRLAGTYPKEHQRRKAAAFRARYPEKAHAKSLVRLALLSGRLKRPQHCEECHSIPEPRIDGASGVHGHHDDYSKPLEVRWLCIKCHSRIHRHALEARTE